MLRFCPPVLPLSHQIADRQVAIRARAQSNNREHTNQAIASDLPATLQL
jgi:hypothetical protein